VTESSLESDRSGPLWRRQAVRWIVAALGVLVLFAAGVVLGAALESNPSNAGSTTFVHTYAPLPAAPLPQTVTLTVTSP
jgi:hypothetical protein